MNSSEICPVWLSCSRASPSFRSLFVTGSHLIIKLLAATFQRVLAIPRLLKMRCDYFRTFIFFNKNSQMIVFRCLFGSLIYLWWRHCLPVTHRTNILSLLRYKVVERSPFIFIHLFSTLDDCLMVSTSPHVCFLFDSAFVLFRNR
jgi:hypothetical protein